MSFLLAGPEASWGYLALRSTAEVALTAAGGTAACLIPAVLAECVRASSPGSGWPVTACPSSSEP